MQDPLTLLIKAVKKDEAERRAARISLQCKRDDLLATARVCEEENDPLHPNSSLTLQSYIYRRIAGDIRVIEMLLSFPNT